MVKQFQKVQKCAMELALYVAEKNYEGFKEEDMHMLTESINILNDLYETLYDEVFEEPQD